MLTVTERLALAIGPRWAAISRAWRLSLLVAGPLLLSVAFLFHGKMSKPRHPAVLVLFLAYVAGPLLALMFVPWFRRLVHRKRLAAEHQSLLRQMLDPRVLIALPAIILSLLWGLPLVLTLVVFRTWIKAEMIYKSPILISWTLMIPAAVAYFCVASGALIFGAWLAVGAGSLAVVLAFSGLQLEGKVLRWFGSAKEFSPTTVLANGLVFAVSSGAVHFAIWKRWPTEYVNIHSWLDTLYFSVVTMATVGYGDVAPVGALAKWATLLQIVISVMILAIAVSAAISVWIMNHQPGSSPEDTSADRVKPEGGSAVQKQA